MNVSRMGVGRGVVLALAALVVLGLHAASADAQDAPVSRVADTRVEILDSSEDAGVASVNGRVTLESGGETSRVNPGTRFRAGDVVRVASGSRLTVALADESTIALLGPAEMQFVELNPEARRVMLRSGVISEAYMQGVALEIRTPYEGSLVLQNATGFARVRPGDRVAFQKLDGDLAQTFTQGRLQPLDVGWTLNVRSGELDTGALANASGDEASARMHRIVLGGRQIAWGPPQDFKVEQTADKLKLTYVGDDYGVVKVGPHSTVFFLSNGESVTFDEDGNVIQFDGISHIYHPLFNPLPDYDEPVENAADASVSNPGRR